MFAIITFRQSGPIKTWAAMRAANVHNARTKPLAHAVPGAPGPRHLIGGRDLVADVEARMRIAQLDPHRLRKNGVIAYEAIMTASAEFFDRGTEAERRARLETWTQAQVAWAKERYGMLRIASMVLHQDEKTPHIHLVVLPLELKVDKRRTDQGARWSLIGRTISGPGRFDEMQDAYAVAMAPFELVRGVRGSGRKHEPVPIYLARLAAKERQVDAIKAVLTIDTAGLVADRAVLDAKMEDLEHARREHAAAVERQGHDDDERRRRLEWDRDAMLSLVAAQRREVAATKAALEREKVEHAAYVAASEQRIAADRDAVRCQEAASIVLRDQLAEAVANQRREAAATSRALEAAIALQDEAEQERAAAAADRASVGAMADKVEAHRVQLLPTMRAAADFRRKVAALNGQPLTQAASATQAAVRELTTAMSSAAPPRDEVRPEIVAFYNRLRKAGTSLG